MGVFHNLAKTARYYRFVYHTEEGRIAQAMVDLQDAVILLSSLDHAHALLCRGRHRLLQQDVVTSPQRGYG